MSFPFAASALDIEDREDASRPPVARAAMDSLRRVVHALRASNVGVEREHRQTVQERLVHGFETLSPSTQSALADGLDAWLSAAGLRDVPATMFLEE
jgi:hypothetical protein